MDERDRQLLDDLRRAIDEMEAGHGDRDRIAELAGVIERRLRAEHELTDDDDTIGEELNEAAIRLEADHPTLAGVLRRALDLLGGIGL